MRSGGCYSCVIGSGHINNYNRVTGYRGSAYEWRFLIEIEDFLCFNSIWAALRGA